MEVRQESRLVPLVVYVGGLLMMFLGMRVFPTIQAAQTTLTAAGFGLVVRLPRTLLEGGARQQRRKGLYPADFCRCSRSFRCWRWSSPSSPPRRASGTCHPSPKPRRRHAKSSRPSRRWCGFRCCVVTAIPILFAERALYPMRRAENIEGPAGALRGVGRSHLGPRRHVWRALHLCRQRARDQSRLFLLSHVAAERFDQEHRARAGRPGEGQHLFPPHQRRRTRSRRVFEGARSNRDEVHLRGARLAARAEPRQGLEGHAGRRPRGRARTDRRVADLRHRHGGRAPQAEDAGRGFPKSAPQGVARNAHRLLHHRSRRAQRVDRHVRGAHGGGRQEAARVAELHRERPGARPGARHRDPQGRHHGRRARSVAAFFARRSGEL